MARKRGPDGRFVPGDMEGDGPWSPYHDLSQQDEADLLAQMHADYDYDCAAQLQQRAEAAIDMRYVAGDPWKPEDRTAREDAKRPCMAFDELNQYFNQAINGIHANPRAIKYSPTGKASSEKTAQFYADKTREIEYRSQGQIVYTTAFQNMIHQGEGFCRIKTKYGETQGTRFLQDLWLEEIVNPNTVTMDSDAKRPSGMDARRCWVREKWTRKAFVKRFPKARVTNFDAYMSTYADWIGDGNLWLAEYWVVESKTRTLLLVQAPGVEEPTELYQDEVPKDVLETLTIIEQRDVEEPSVCQYLTNGVEILDRKPWAGKYIPIARCQGLVLYVEGTKKVLSMTRLARDPMMGLAYLVTQEFEMIGMVPKIPVMVAVGQLAGQENDWEAAAHEPKAYVQYHDRDPNDPTHVYPPPARIPYDAGQHLAALEVVKESVRRSIQSAMAIANLPSQAQRQNEKSGVALKRIEQAQERGAYHYVAHYDDMITFIGIMVEDLLPKILDTDREVGVREANETAKTVRIGQGGLDITGDHLVTISTGPNFDSAREQGSDFAQQLIGNPILPQVLGPQKFAELLAMAVRLLNLGPIGDEIANLISPKPGTDGTPDPAQLTQKLQEAQAMMQQMQQAGQELQKQLETKQVEQQGKLQQEKLKQIGDLAKARMDNATKMYIADLNVKTKGIETAQTLEHEAIALMHTKAHEATQADLDRAHDLGMAALGHERAMEAGDISHGQTLEAQEQAAALAPQPEAGA